MTPTMKAAADKQLKVYAKLPKAFLQARFDDARAQALAIPEHAAYWTYIADGCEALLKDSKRW